jgi:hypothetical protein
VERFVVTRIRRDLWLVSHQGRPPSMYLTESEALSAMFAAASNYSRAGTKTAVVITQARVGDELSNQLILCRRCQVNGRQAHGGQFGRLTDSSGAVGRGFPILPWR